MAVALTLATLKEGSEADNMLLEYRLALELKAQGKLRAIFPVFVGEPEKMGSLGMVAALGVLVKMYAQRQAQKPKPPKL